MVSRKISEAAANHAGGLVVIATGPLTNLALAVHLDAQLVANGTYFTQPLCATATLLGKVLQSSTCMLLHYISSSACCVPAAAANLRHGYTEHQGEEQLRVLSITQLAHVFILQHL